MMVFLKEFFVKLPRMQRVNFCQGYVLALHVVGRRKVMGCGPGIIEMLMTAPLNSSHSK